MRKMDYCRYDSPTNFGTIDAAEKSSFILDHPLENGIYMVIITDPADQDIHTLFLTIRDDVNTSYADFMSLWKDSQSRIYFAPDNRNIINVDQYSLGEGSTIELYKLN